MLNLKYFRSGSLLACFCFLVGCTIPVDTYTRPDLSLPVVPEGVVQSVSQKEWWLNFQDPVLTAFVNEAINRNWNLVKAGSDVALARANLAGTQSLTSPALNAGINYSGTRRKFGTTTSQSEFNTLTRTASASLALGWELDLWGRIEQLGEAANARLNASELVFDATRLSVASLVTEAYFQWRTLQRKQQTMQKISEHLQAIRDLQHRRWTSGLGTEAAYRQSQIELVSAQAHVLLFEEGVSQSALALQVLLGRSPREIGNTLPFTEGAIHVPSVPSVLDTQVLLRRPDVAAAEWALKASYADVNVSRVERYPRLGLSMVGGLLSSTSNWVSGTPSWLDIGLGVGAPVMDGGLNAAKVNASIVRRDYAKAQYHQSVLEAYRDLHRAVLAQTTSDQHIALLENELALQQQVLMFTKNSLMAGRISQYDMLSEQIKVLQVQLSLSDARQAQWLSRCHFYKAIGGGV